MDERTDTCTLAASPQAPARARQFLAERLAAWGQRDLLAEAIFGLSELVTNAFLHGGGDITVVVTLGTALRVAVHDSGAGQPAVRQYSSTATTGRGLHLVDSLSDRWGTTPDGTGKWVWFEQDLVAAAPAPAADAGEPPAAQASPLRSTGRGGSGPKLVRRDAA